VAERGKKERDGKRKSVTWHKYDRRKEAKRRKEEEAEKEMREEA